MLLPFLILTVRLVIFTLANILSLLAFGVAFSVLGIFSGGILAVIALPLWAFLPFIITSWIYRRSFKELDTATLPNWLPGVKYLTWRSQMRKQRSKSKWLKWLTPSLEEGLKAAFISTASIFIIGSLGMRLAFFSERPGKAFAYFLKTEFGYWLIGFIVLAYALDTWFSWKYYNKRWQNFKKQPNYKTVNSPTNAPIDASTDDELNRLKQKIQSQDGYLSQGKPEPKDKKKS